MEGSYGKPGSKSVGESCLINGEREKGFVLGEWREFEGMKLGHFSKGSRVVRRGWWEESIWEGWAGELKGESDLMLRGLQLPRRPYLIYKLWLGVLRVFYIEG